MTNSFVMTYIYSTITPGHICDDNESSKMKYFMIITISFDNIYGMKNKHRI